MTTVDRPDAAKPRPRVLGIDLDPNTRCAHYHTAVDIIAVKLKCCGEYYACKECHDAFADHALAQWPVNEYDTPAVLCGQCSSQLTIAEYLRCDNRCPACSAAFNPRCSVHHHFYFSSI